MGKDMNWPWWEDLQYGDDVFIPIENAFYYLDDDRSVFELKRLYYHYKGFALEDKSMLVNRMPKRVYLDAMCFFNVSETKQLWKSYYAHIEIIKEKCDFDIGRINGKLYDVLDLDCYLFHLESKKVINNSDFYVRKDDLDTVSHTYGIPRKNSWDDDSFKPNNLKHKKYSEIDIVATSYIANNDNSSPQSLIVEYVKKVLTQYPSITTADLKKNCFEGMDVLNARDGKKINDLLTMAGARRAAPGEHAKELAWKNKYPKVQWVRVFNKKN
jgi:hypothetical protein